LGSIPGIVPAIGPDFVGCAFRARCAQAIGACSAPIPKRDMANEHQYHCRLDPGWREAA
jgi:peptide/nickel transport system ATP-binding protein